MSEEFPRILIVDDNPDWRATLSGLLRDEGYRAAVAASSREALDLLVDENFELAVIDIRLDESNKDNTEGITLAKEIHVRWPQTSIIIITGYETPATLKDAMKPDSQGISLVFNYILKDNTQELVPEVRRALEAREVYR